MERRRGKRGLHLMPSKSRKWIQRFGEGALDKIWHDLHLEFHRLFTAVVIHVIASVTYWGNNAQEDIHTSPPNFACLHHNSRLFPTIQVTRPMKRFVTWCFKRNFFPLCQNQSYNSFVKLLSKWTKFSYRLQTVNGETFW